MKFQLNVGVERKDGEMEMEICEYNHKYNPTSMTEQMITKMFI